MPTCIHIDGRKMQQFCQSTQLPAPTHPATSGGAPRCRRPPTTPGFKGLWMQTKYTTQILAWPYPKTKGTMKQQTAVRRCNQHRTWSNILTCPLKKSWHPDGVEDTNAAFSKLLPGRSKLLIDEPQTKLAIEDLSSSMKATPKWLAHISLHLGTTSGSHGLTSHYI